MMSRATDTGVTVEVERAALRLMRASNGAGMVVRTPCGDEHLVLFNAASVRKVCAADRPSYGRGGTRTRR
jgi:hypothetical protein